ncbi:transformer-2 protein homolog beta isoform X5 [Narcine bancroftii]|uniref:transformer-2 protein homolog beta isoform X5 n=1 Tax=Narcine bancroftii TaxID=1343680 RepID=UPI0038312541
MSDSEEHTYMDRLSTIEDKGEGDPQLVSLTLMREESQDKKKIEAFRIHVPHLNQQVKVYVDLANLPANHQQILQSALILRMGQGTPGPSRDHVHGPNPGLYLGGVLGDVIQGLDPDLALGVGDPGAGPTVLIIGVAEAIVGHLCQIVGVILVIGLTLTLTLVWEFLDSVCIPLSEICEKCFRGMAPSQVLMLFMINNQIAPEAFPSSTLRMLMTLKRLKNVQMEWN